MGDTTTSGLMPMTDTVNTVVTKSGVKERTARVNSQPMGAVTQLPPGSRRLFNLVPAAGLTTMLLVYVISTVTQRLPAWPLQSVSRYGGMAPAVYGFRAATAVGAVLMFKAGWMVRKRSQTIAIALEVASFGLLGIGAVGIYEEPRLHRFLSWFFFAGLVAAGVDVAQRMRSRETEHESVSGRRTASYWAAPDVRA